MLNHTVSKFLGKIDPLCIVQVCFCISDLLLHNKSAHTWQLKKAHIYYLEISVGQESKHSSAGSSAQGLQSCGQGAVKVAGLLHEAGDPLPGSLVAGKVHFLEAAGLIAACLFQASERESLTCL